MARSLTKAYDRVKNIDWEPTYISAAEKYVEPTRFFLPKKAIDPFKTFIREYFAMEREKESRHYSLLEAASRIQTTKPEPRWMEGMKFALSNLSAIEYSAGRQMGRMARVVAPTELRQGYMMQVLDEMRHTQLEMNALRHHMRSWPDPSGYDIALKAAGNSVGRGSSARCRRTSRLATRWKPRWDCKFLSRPRTRTCFSSAFRPPPCRAVIR